MGETTSRAGTADQWNPATYRRFAAERRQPFDDLLSLIRPAPGGRAVDLGCGPGELTVDLHRHLGAAETVGIDTSEVMLAEATGVAGEGVSFAAGDLAGFGTDAADRDAWDVIAASA